MIKRALLILLVFAGCTTGGEDHVFNRLHYRFTGAGTKTLLFIHGWCINQTYWNSQVNYFRDRYRVLTLDLAGHGRSRGKPTDGALQSYANDIVELVNELELENVILVAHSMAGNIALHVYDKVPDRIIGIVGVDNLQQLGAEHTPEEIQQVSYYFDQMRRDFKRLSRSYAEAGLFSSSTPDSVRNRVIHDFQDCDSLMAVAALQSLVQEGANEKLLAPRLKIPLMLILSDAGQKPLVDSVSLTRYCGAGYRINTVKGTGHYPMVEAPAEFNQRLNEALKQVQ